MTDYFDRDLATLDEIEDLLEAYADARFTPSGPALARMRAHVLADAATLAAARAAERRQAASRAATPGRRGRFDMRLPRRAFALGMAATLTLGTTAAVLAAPPGSPFYNARVAIEVALLPSQVDDRLTAHEQHLDARLAEADAAAARGDLVALEAALAAYRVEVDAAVADVGDDAGRLAQLEAAIAKHTVVLQALAVRLPEQSAIEHAIDASQKASTKLKDKGNHGGGRPTGAPTGPNTQQP